MYLATSGKGGLRRVHLGLAGVIAGLRFDTRVDYSVQMISVMVTCIRFEHHTLLLKGAFNGFFAMAITAVDLLEASNGFAGTAGRELVKAPFEDKLLVCMLDSIVIDIIVKD